MSSDRPASLLNRQHAAVALLVAWLIFTSPWVSMLRRVPSGAGFFDYAHVALGFVALAAALAYTLSCTRRGGWRLYFPWLSGGFAAVRSDVSGLLLRGRIPSAEGGGVFAMLEGLLLLALVATAVTGAVWFLAQGNAAALTWREGHILASRGLIGLAALHIVAVASHLLEL